MSYALLLFLGGVGVIELIVGLAIAFIPAFFLVRFMLKTALRQGAESVNRLAVFGGLLIAPAILAVVTIAISSIMFTWYARGLRSPGGIEETTETDTAWTAPVMPRRSTVHPKAVALLTEEFYWSRHEIAGPFGEYNSDQLWSDFIKWRKDHANSSVVEYRDEFLVKYKFFDNADAGELPGTQLHNDNVTIATGLSQLMLEGRMDEDIKALSREAIERQLTAEMIEQYDDDDYKDVRRSILKKILVLLDGI
ncbi:MAG TPA: hypothetical protein VFE50_26645 [Cyclobacteriaceae bacterium]|nr:hypothetical protein [Cyclobacteriaceae bacterium]